MSIYSKNELENIDDKIILNILQENNLLQFCHIYNKY